MPDATTTNVRAAYFEGYSSFAKTLRTWLVAYGVGGPALVLTQKALADRLMASGTAPRITMLFLIGVACQVLTALIFKASMWYLYLGEGKPDLQRLKRYKVANWVSEAFWIEIGLDLVSLACFGIATYWLLNVFA